jgi:hypothetical protein
MSVAAGHDQIGALIAKEVKELGGDRPPCLPPHFARHDNSMAAKVARDIGKVSFGGFRLAFIDSEDQNLFRPLQKRKGIAHRAAALARLLPRHHDPAELGRSNDVWHDQERPAGAQQDHAGVDEIMHVTPGVPSADNDQIRRSCLPRYEFVRQLKGGTPFNLFEMLALGAESPADVVEECAHRAAIGLRGLVIDDDASRGESRPQRQTGNANEGRAKSIG